MAKGRTTLILFSAVLLLGSFIWIQEVWRAKRPSREVRRIRLFDLQPDTLVSIRFVQTNLVVECIKENGVWMTGQAGEPKGRADVALVHKMLAGLNSMGKGTTITSEYLEMRGLDDAEYGLADPSVEIIAVDNKGRHHWMVGRSSPLADMVYVKAVDAGEIYTVPNFLLAMIPPEGDTLRDRSIFTGSSSAVRRLEIRGSEGFIQVLKDPDAGWLVKQTVTTAADVRAVETYIDRLFRLRVERFEAENIADFSAFGLQGETRQISVGMTDGSTRMLVIGDEIADRPGWVYARRADDTSVFSLPKEALDELDLEADELRDARVMTLSPEEISYLSISKGPDELTLVKDEEGIWSILQPVQWDADQTAVDDMLRLWDAAVITEFSVSNAPSSEVEWTLKIGSSDLNQTNRLEIFPTMGRKDGLILRKAEDPTFFQINLPFFPESLVDPLRFKNKLLWSLSVSDVQKILLEERGGGLKGVERSDEGVFIPLQAGGSLVVDHDALAQLLQALQHPAVSSYVDYNPPDLSIYGLAQPLAVLRISFSEGDELGRILLIGRETTEGYYAMMKGHDVVFILERTLADILMGDVVVPRKPVVSDSE